MKYTKQQIIEYAQLAQQCYNISNNTYKLPENWKLIFSKEGSWDTFYALYENDKKKEIVLGIRGTDTNKIYNYLSNAGLLVGALTGKHEEPPGVNEMEKSAREAITNPNLYRFKNIKEESQELIQQIANFDEAASSPIDKLILSSVKNKESTSQDLSTGSSPTNISSSEKDKESNDQLLNQSFFGSFSELKKVLFKFKEQYYPSFSFRIVGHSLGGVIAELCAVKFDVDCVSFESPGSLEILEQMSRRKPNEYNYEHGSHDIVSFLSAPNLINTLNGHPGEIYRLKLPHTESTSSALHNVNCLFQTGSSLFTYASLGASGLAALTAPKAVASKLISSAAYHIATESAKNVLVGPTRPSFMESISLSSNKGLSFHEKESHLSEDFGFINHMLYREKEHYIEELARGKLIEEFPRSIPVREIAEKFIAQDTVTEVGKKMLKDLATNKLLGEASKVLVAGSGITEVLKNRNWLVRQHSIDNIVSYLLHKDSKLVEIDSWPRANLNNLSSSSFWLKNLKESGRDFLPLQKDKPGIINLNDEEGMREAQMMRILGYKEKNTNVTLLLDINKMKKEMEEWRAKKKWLEQERQKYRACQEIMARLSVNQEQIQVQIEVPPRN